MSSINSQGMPESALVGIAVTPGLEIIFDTLKRSRKYCNLKDRPDCSLVVGWENEQTVQYEGSAFEPTGDELAGYQQDYFAAWSDGRERVTWPNIAYFVVKPRWIRFSDYGVDPMMIKEFNFASRSRK